jgi:hypothetical protein
MSEFGAIWQVSGVIDRWLGPRRAGLTLQTEQTSSRFDIISGWVSEYQKFALR